MKKYLLLFFLCKLCYATCLAQPTNPDFIEINNFKFIVNKSLALFNNNTTVTAALDIPKESSISPVFSMSILLTSYDSNGKPYTNTAYLPGLTNGDCSQLLNTTSFNFDKAEMEIHRLFANNPNYVVPSKIADYPASGMANGLVPFKDYNGNNTYEPQLGEHPDFPGDFAVYLFNHNFDTSLTQLPMLIDVITVIYGVNSNEEYLKNTLFIQHKVVNKSEIVYNDFRFGNYVDFDLGNNVDDFVGTNVDLNSIYVYNGDEDDDSNGVVGGYGINPPAFAVSFLSESIDNSWTSALYSSNPSDSAFYHSVMRGKRADGTPFHYFGLNEEVANEYKFAFPDNSDPTGRGFVNGKPASYPAWTETSQNNLPGDRRMYGSTAGRSLAPGEVACYVNALVWSRNSNASATDGGRKALFLDLPKVRNFYNQNITCE